MFDWFAPTANWEAVAFAGTWLVVSVFVCVMIDIAEGKKR